MTDQVQVLIGGQIEGLTAALGAAQEELESFTAPISGLAGGFSALAEAAAAAFAVDKLESFIEGMAELGAGVQHASQMLGLSAEQVSTFDFAAKAMGLGTEGANTALERLERNMAEAATTPGLAANAFEALGIKVTDTSRHLRSLDDILPEIADKFHDTADGPAKTAIAIALMGRSGAQMIPLLDQGRAGLEAFKQAAQDAGAVITGPMAEGMEHTSIGITTLGSAFQGIGITLFEAFKPAIDTVVKGLTDLVEGFNSSLKEGGALNTTLGELVVTIDVIIAVIDTLVAGLRQLWEVGEGALRNLSQGFATLGQVMLDVSTGKFSSVVADFNAGWAKMTQVSVQSFDQMRAAGQRWADDLRELFSNISLTMSGGPGGLLGSVFGVDTSGGSAAGGGAALPQLGAISSQSGASQQVSMMQQWREALQQQLVDEQSFFKSSQSEELAYWQSKLATAEQYESEYGITLKQAQQLHLQVQTQIYDLEKQQSQEWLQSYMAGLNEQLAALKDELDEKRISEQAYFNQSIALEQNRQQVLKQLGLEGTAAYADSLKNMEALDRQHVQASEQSWNSIFTFIDNNLDQMLTGVLRGTQTWQQALTRVFDNMATSFIEDVAKMMVKWAAFEALGVGSNPFTGMANTLSSLFGGAGGNAANQATQQLTAAITGQTAATVQNTGGIFSQISSGLQWIAQTLGLTTASATQTAATTASAATTTGGLIPALVALTAAVIANTAAQGMSGGGSLIGGMTPAAALMAGIIPLATGAWSIPQDMIALVHEGEAVLPRDVAAQMRAGQPPAFPTGGGALTAGAGAAPMVFQINLSAIDTQTGAQFLLNNMPTIARGLGTQFRNANPNLRPS